MATRPTVYWDANAFLGLINQEFEPQELADMEAVWTAAKQGHVLIATSTFTMKKPPLGRRKGER